MNWLVTLIVAVLRAFLPALVQRSKDKCEEGKSDPVLKKRLRNRVRRTWGAVRLWPLVPILVCLMSGCATRTIYVPDGEPVRLREMIRNAKVWVIDSQGQPAAGVMDLPEGWYGLPVNDFDSSDSE